MLFQSRIETQFISIMAELPPTGLGFDLDPAVKYIVSKHGMVPIVLPQPEQSESAKTEVPPPGMKAFAPQQPTFNFAMPPAETQSDSESDPESDSFGDCLLVELFRDVSPGNVYTGNYVLDKIWATWIACNHIIGNPKAVEFEKEFEGLYFAKKKE